MAELPLETSRESEKEEDSYTLLKKYFTPVFGNPLSLSQPGEVTKPFWLYRKQNHSENPILESLLQEAFLDKEHQLIVEILKRISEPSFCFSKLNEDEQERLIKLQKDQQNECSPYAKSVYVSLSLRDPKISQRKKAISLLKNDDVDHPFLTTTFVDLTYVNFIDLDISDLNLSGHNLQGSKWPKKIGDVTLRYANLSNVDFSNKTLEKLDLTGALLTRSQFVDSSLKNVIFHKAVLCGANFSNAYFRKSSTNKAFHWTALQFTNFKGAKFFQLDFKDCDFEDAIFDNTKLNSVQFERCSNMPDLVGRQVKFNDVQACYLSLSYEQQNLLNKEKINVDMIQPFILPAQKKIVSALREAERIHKQFQDSRILERDKNITELPPNSIEYQRIIEIINATSTESSYRVPFLESVGWSINDLLSGEFSRGLKRVTSTPNLDIVEGITISRIEKLHNPELLQRYQQTKNKIRDTLESFNVVDPLSKICWHGDKIAKGLPITDSSVGECLLYHGTNMDHINSIRETGFRLNKSPSHGLLYQFRGYGALGNAIYFSDLFSKSATYIQCGKCKLASCNCDEADHKALLLCRVVLGHIHIDEDKKRTDAKAASKNFQSSYGPHNQYYKKSEFNCNEFAVFDKTQAYPEYCIHYTLNKPLSKQKDAENSEKSPKLFSYNAIPRDNITLDTIYLLLVNYHQNKEYKTLTRLEKIFSDIKQFKNFNSYEHALLFKIQKRFYDEALTHLRDLRLGEEDTQHQQMLLVESYRTLARYQLNNLSAFLPPAETLRIHLLKKVDCLCNIEPDSAGYWQLMAETASQLDNHNEVMIKALNQVKSINEIFFNRELKKHNPISYDRYITISLELLQAGIKEKSNQIHITWLNHITISYNDRLIEKRISIDEWEKNYWRLPDTCREKFKNDMLERLPKEFSYEHFRLAMLPNQYGERVKVKEDINEWENFIDSNTNNKKGFEIRWLSHNGVVMQGKLNERWAKELFTDNGSINLFNAREGRSAVIPLYEKNDSSKAVAYAKFYPRYPWRQLAIDMLIRRLSGLAPINTFVAIDCGDTTYPVMLTKPLGETYEQQYVLGENIKSEHNLDPYYFTWKFFEAWIVQNIDEKADNGVLQKLKNNLYTWICFDTDMVLSGSVNVGTDLGAYTLVYCMSQMKNEPSHAAINAFQVMEFKVILDRWVDSLATLTKSFNGEYPIKLFDATTTDALNAQFKKNKTFETAEKKNVNQASNITDCLRMTDLPNIFQRTQQIKDACSKLERHPEKNMHFLGHFRLLSYLHLGFTNFYWDAFSPEKKDMTAYTRFLALPNLLEHFKQDAKLSVIRANNPEMKGQAFHLTTAQFGRSIHYNAEEVTKYKAYRAKQQPMCKISQLEQLKNQFDKEWSNIRTFSTQIGRITKREERALFFFDQQKNIDAHLIEKLIKYIPWPDLKETNFGRDLLKKIVHLSLERVVLRDCDQLTDDQLISLVTESAYLTELALINCENISQVCLHALSRSSTLIRLDLKQLNWEYIDGYELVKWSEWLTGTTEFPLENLSTWTITDCKKLKIVTKLHLVHLKFFQLKNNPRLEHVQLHLEKISRVNIAGCHEDLSFEINGENNIHPDSVQDPEIQWRLVQNIRKQLSKNDLSEFKKLKLTETCEYIVNGSWFKKLETLHPITFTRPDELLTIHYTQHPSLSEIVFQNSHAINDDMMYQILKNLPALRRLHLVSCKNLSHLSQTTIGYYAINLQELHCEDLEWPSLKIWGQSYPGIPITSPALPQLQTLTVTNCVKLKSIEIGSPELQLLALKTLPAIESVIVNTVTLGGCSLHSLDVLDTMAFIRLVGATLPTLKNLEINHLPNLDMQRTIKHFWKFQMRAPYFWNWIVNNKSLNLQGYYLSKKVIRGMPILPRIKTLNLENCLGTSRENIFLLLANLPHIEYLQWIHFLIKDIPTEKNFISHKIKTFENQISSYIILPNSRMVIVFKNGRIITRTNEGDERVLIEPMEGETKKICLAILPDGRLLQSSENDILIWNVDLSDKSTHPTQHRSPITKLYVLPNGRLVSISEKSLHIWSTDFSYSRKLATKSINPKFQPSISVLPDGRLVFANNKSIIIWSSNFLKPISITTKNTVSTLFVLSDSRLVSGHSDGSIRIWNENFTKSDNQREHLDSVESFNELPDGRLLTATSHLVISSWTRDLRTQEKLTLDRRWGNPTILHDGTMITTCKNTLITSKLASEPRDANLSFIKTLDNTIEWCRKKLRFTLSIRRHAKIDMNDFKNLKAFILSVYSEKKFEFQEKDSIIQFTVASKNEASSLSKLFACWGFIESELNAPQRLFPLSPRKKQVKKDFQELLLNPKITGV